MNTNKIYLIDGYAFSTQEKALNYIIRRKAKDGRCDLDQDSVEESALDAADNMWLEDSEHFYYVYFGKNWNIDVRIDINSSDEEDTIEDFSSQNMFVEYEVHVKAINERAAINTAMEMLRKYNAS